MFLIGKDVNTNKILIVKYNGKSWQKLGNQDALDFDSSYGTSYQAIIDSHDNIYLVINNGLSVYHYNPTTKNWDSIGKRSFADANNETANSFPRSGMSLGLSKDESTLYLADYPEVWNVDKIHVLSNYKITLYSYKLH